MTDVYKKPTDSDTVITELMIPAYANFGGKIHGGQLLSMMDKVAYACATKHAEQYSVTVAVDNVNFMQAVDVGDLVHMMARVNFTGNSSMVVGIKVTAENVREQVVKHTNTSYFTMVAKTDDGQIAPVPGLLLTDETALRRFAEAQLRRQRMDEHRDAMRRLTADFDIDRARRTLAGSNCSVQLD